MRMTSKSAQSTAHDMAPAHDKAAQSPLLSVSGLEVSFATPDGTVQAVRRVDLTLNRSETLAIVGESGSGKSQVVMAIMGLLARNGAARGEVCFAGAPILNLPSGKLNAYRGKRMAMIFQEPMTALDPLMRVGDQIAAPLRRHLGLSRTAALQKARELLEKVGIPEPDRRLRAFPHQLSGGQRQRVLIALALGAGPELLIADEPTTALDVTVQAQILGLLARLQHETGMGMIFISHDLGIVRAIADRVAVMHHGRIVEIGRTEEIFAHPREDYTKMLLAAEPTGRKPPVPASAPVVLEARNITVRFRLPGVGLFGGERRVLNAVDDVSLTLHAGQTIGIVGESGSGKSTLGRAILRLLPSEGTIAFEGRDGSSLDARAMRPLRARLQAVFQDPYGSLSPRMTVGDIITEGYLVHRPEMTRRDREAAAARLLETVQLDAGLRNRFPHEFSGGQRQRIAIARALALEPAVMLLDEPTSALDRSIQKGVIDLLRALQEARGLSYLFISHDLAVVRALADHVLVMQGGRIVEAGATEQIFAAPQMAYTKTLMAAALTDRVAMA